MCCSRNRRSAPQNQAPRTPPRQALSRPPSSGPHRPAGTPTATACTCSSSEPEREAGSSGSSSAADAANSGSAPPGSSPWPRPASWHSPTASRRVPAATLSGREWHRRVRSDHTPPPPPRGALPVNLSWREAAQPRRRPGATAHAACSAGRARGRRPRSCGGQPLAHRRKERKQRQLSTEP